MKDTQDKIGYCQLSLGLLDARIKTVPVKWKN